jgi:hypothetical protein
MKKTLLLLFVIFSCLVSKAADGIRVDGVTFANGATMYVGCGTDITMTMSAWVSPSLSVYAYDLTDYPSGWTAVDCGDNCYSFTTNFSSSGLIKFRYTNLSGSITGTVSLYMTRIDPTLMVTGPDVVCGSTATFGFSGTYYTGPPSYSSSNPSVMSINSSTGVATVTGNGSVTIQATVSTLCGSTPISKTVQVGTYTPAQFSVSGPSQTCPYPDESEVYVSINPVTAPTSISGYNWTYSSNWPFGYSPSGYDYKLVPPSAGFGSAWVKLSIQNACGWSLPYQWDIFESSGCAGFFSVAPNPSTGNVISILFSETVVSKGAPEKVEIFSEESGLLIMSLSDIEKKLTQGKKLEIDVSMLKRGAYVIHVTGSKFVGNKTKKTKIILL